MIYDFDRIISRKGTASTKWNMLQKGVGPDSWCMDEARYFGENPVLPMWVADMDFPCPEPVVDALIQRAGHGIFGYTVRTNDYDAAVKSWMHRRQGWDIDPEWICTTPGIVPAIHFLVQTFIKPGQKVLVQKPVYYPFFRAIENNGGKIVSNNLVLDKGHYKMDFQDLDKKTSDPDLTLAILCSPHNPVGRVWSKQELMQFGRICAKNNVQVISDEIHGDLIFKGECFIPFATIEDEFSQNAVICTAPSKTFNLAGLNISNIIIPNKKTRSRFLKTLNSLGLVSALNPFGTLACETAYNKGEEWLDQVLCYIEDNLDFLCDFIDHHIPQISVIRPQGTYLVWLDCRKLGLDKRGLKKLMLEDAGIFLDEGFIFGSEGEGFERINIACPRSIIKEALGRMKRAVQS